MTLSTRPVERLVGTALILLMAVGSLALWMLVPAAVLWSIGQLTVSPSVHLMLALVAVPAAMVAFSVLLLLLNASYLRVIGADQPVEDEDGIRIRYRGPLESLLVWSFIVAAVWGLIWLIAHPLPQFSVG